MIKMGTFCRLGKVPDFCRPATELCQHDTASTCTSWFGTYQLVCSDKPLAVNICDKVSENLDYADSTVYCTPYALCYFCSWHGQRVPEFRLDSKLYGCFCQVSNRVCVSRLPTTDIQWGRRYIFCEPWPCKVWNHVGVFNIFVLTLGELRTISGVLFVLGKFPFFLGTICGENMLPKNLNSYL